MTSWASPRDELPESVHALMSLWGGFAPPAENGNDGSLEKRLELDFAAPIALAAPHAALSVPELEGLMLPVGQYLEDYSFQEVEEMAAVTFTEALVVVMPRRLIVTCASSVMLHEVLRPLLALLAEKGVAVEWAAFFRENIFSPWAAVDETTKSTSDVMASEYAELKAAFPSGQSFLTGPVDGDHYFHFVYDDIKRCNGTAAVAETDVQINVYLYDCEAGEESSVGSKNSQTVVPLSAAATGRTSEYEITRTFASFSHVSFETNALAAAESPSRVADIVATLAPARFIIVALQDKDTAAESAAALSAFDGYVRQHRSVNYFGEGYAFQQLVFVRAE